MKTAPLTIRERFVINAFGIVGGIFLIRLLGPLDFESCLLALLVTALLDLWRHDRKVRT